MYLCTSVWIVPDGKWLDLTAFQIDHGAKSNLHSLDILQFQMWFVLDMWKTIEYLHVTADRSSKLSSLSYITSLSTPLTVLPNLDLL